MAATRYAWESSTGNTHMVGLLADAKRLAVTEYCAFIASFDPQANPIIDWKAGPGISFWMLYADGEPTTWLIRRVTTSMPSETGA